MKNKLHSSLLQVSIIVSPLLQALVLSLAALVITSASALENISDEGLSGVSGEGLAFPFENIRLQMAPTSFVELTGVPFASCTGGTAASPTPSGCVSFLKRGDLRYYGLTISQGATYSGLSSNKMTYNLSTANTMNWDRTSCTGGINGMGCPASQYGINEYSTADNPFVLRAFDYDKMGYGGTNTTQTVLEFIGPSNMDPFRWAFWGEAEAGRVVDATGAITGTTGLLKNQVLILGKAAARVKPPSLNGYDDTGASANPYVGPVLRLFQDGRTSSLGLAYASRLSGDFRFSVNQLNDTQDARGLVPTFTTDEGLYFHNVNAYMPLGQLNYQTVTFDRVAAGNGNFIMELTSIPNTAGVYGAHYSLPTFSTAPFGACGAANFTGTTTPCNQYVQGYNRDKNSALTAYYDTHGYVEWGTAFPSWANVWPTICAGSLGVSSCNAT